MEFNSALHEVVPVPVLVEPVELVVEELVTLVELDTFEEVDAFVELERVELETPAAAVLSAEPHAARPSATTATKYFSIRCGFRAFMADPPLSKADQKSRATAMPAVD